MEIYPLNERILIEVSTEAETTESGMLIGHSPGERTEAVAVKGIVMKIHDKIKEKVEYKVGETVYVSKWEGQHASFQGKQYLLVKNDDIVSVVR